MQIRASMIAFMVRKRSGRTIELGGNANCVIEHARVYRGSAMNQATLYVLSSEYRMQSVLAELPAGVAESCAFVACPDAGVTSEELLECVGSALVELTRWDASLKDALLNDLTLPMVIELGEDIFTNPYAFVDKDLVTLAASERYSDHIVALMQGGADDPFEIDRAQKPEDLARRKRTGLANDEDQLPPQRVRELVEDERFFAVARLKEPFYYDSPVGPWTSYCINLIEDGIWMVRLVFYSEDGARLDPGEELLAQHFFGYIVEIYRRFTGAFESARSQSDTLHALLRDVLVGQQDFDPAAAREALALYGWDASNEYTVVKLVFFAGANWETAAPYICRQLERQWRNSVAFTLGTSIVWLFNHSLVQIKHHGGEFMSSVVHLLREHACKAGLSDTFDDFGLVRTYYHEAELALSLGQVRDPHFWYFNFGDYALDYIAYQATRQLGANQVAHKGLLALKAHDAAKGTDYVETLKAYLDNNQNAVRTAEQLFVHRTSLIRRIQRIEKIGNLNLADANEVAYLQISFRILE